MREKKRSFVVFAVIIVTFLLTATAGCHSDAEEKSIKIPDKAIDTIQVNGLKIHASENSVWGDFESFVLSLEDVVPLDVSEKQSIKRGENYHVVTLRYEDQSRESFYFFQTDAAEDKWYVENGDGTVFRNAEFFTQYLNVPQAVSPSDSVPANELKIQNPAALKSFIKLTMQLKEWEITYDTTDLRAFFAVEMHNQLENGSTEPEAVQFVRNKLTGQMKQYYYAVQNGFSLTEEELKARMDVQDSVIKSASNYAQLAASYEECGATYDEYRQWTKEYSRLQFTIENLYNAAYEEFRHGNDKIGERVCENFMEYWTYYLQDVVYPAAETYSEETLIPLLDEAEAFYAENLSSGAE